MGGVSKRSARPRSSDSLPPLSVGSRRTVKPVKPSSPGGGGGTSAPSERPTAHPGDVKEALMPELRKLYSAGDYETALPMAEAVIAVDPDPEVKVLIDVCRERLVERYTARLGTLGAVPLLKVPPNEWMTLDLDPRACFLLVHVDNISNFEMIVDSSAMSPHEALRVLTELLERGIIGL